MHKHLRGLATGLVSVAAMLATSRESPAAERLVVRTYNTFGVTAGEMTNAHAVAKVILQDAGLQAVWRDCCEGCADALGPAEVLVRIVAAPETTVAESLGCAVIDLERGAGTLATVYADRINVLAFRTGVNPATLLGRAIAHEIGHLLLGTVRHSAAGLMRARWSDRELERHVAGDWTFSREDVARMGRGLGARHCRGVFRNGT